jgi:DNA-binding protein Fis
LRACAGNKTRASAILGITPKTLHAKLRQYQNPSGGAAAEALS